MAKHSRAARSRATTGRHRLGPADRVHCVHHFEIRSSTVRRPSWWRVLFAQTARHTVGALARGGRSPRTVRAILASV